MPSEEENRLLFERDLAVRQAKLCETDLLVVQQALTDNRPLEALRTVNEALNRLDEDLDALEEIQEADDG